MSPEAQASLFPEAIDSVEAAESSESRPLPSPLGPRFQPLRAGILNVWEYEAQEFHFHQGRLILRGENGTGKSKALELLLPFLFDADLRPQRLDPFGGAGRSMRWNLLQNGRHKSRRGYVWLELGRFDGEEPVFLTLGAGMHAGSAKSGVDAWYFITSKRIGGGLSLRDGNTTKESRRLRQDLGEEGRVFARATDYRERLDAELFRLGTERFKALRHLLLQLRRPQLSEKLDPTSLSDLLGESLPPLDDDLIQQLSEGFERLERDEDELGRLQQSQEATRAFLKIYREYCCGIGVQRSREISRGESRYHEARKRHREAESAWTEANGRLAEVVERRQETDQQIVGARAELSALESSEAMRAAEHLQLEEKNARQLDGLAGQHRVDAERCRQRVVAAQQDHEDARERTRDAESVREALVDRTARQAAKIAFVANHEEAVGQLADDAGSQRRGVLATVDAVVQRKKEAVTELRQRMVARDRTEQRFLQRDAQRREASEQSRSAVERHEAAYAAALRERETLDEALAEWSEGLSEFTLDGWLSDSASRSPSEVGESASAEFDLAAFWQRVLDREPEDLAPTLAGALAPQQDALLRSQAAEQSARKITQNARDETQAERDRVAALQQLGPEPPRTRGSSREGRDGAPFYLLCEFAAELADGDRAGLEAALEASGLLDAWVLPDGRLLDRETLDTVLVPKPCSGPTLIDALSPDPEGPVAPEVVEKLLRSVPLGVESREDADEPGFAIGLDGRWRSGPLHGGWRKEAVEHIGTRAREASRRRRLAELDVALARLDQGLHDHDTALHALQRRLRLLRAEYEAAPTIAALRRALLQTEEAQQDAERRRAELSQAELAAGRARQKLEQAEAELEHRAGELGLATVLDDLNAYLERLLDYRNLFADFVKACVDLQTRQLEEERLAHRLDGLRDEAAEAESRAELGARDAFAARAKLDALRETVGKDAEEIVARHSAKSRELEDLEALLTRLHEERDALTETRARLDERRSVLRNEVERQDSVRRAAGEHLQALARQDLLHLILEPVPVDAVESWTWSRTLEMAKTIQQTHETIDTEQAAVDRRADRLFRRLQELNNDLGSEYHASYSHSNELMVVRVSYDRQDYGVRELVERLGEEIARRRDLLAQDERKLLRDFLLGEVGDHLRHRLRASQELTQEMNRLLEACKTASGLVYSLSWEPTEELGDNPRDMIDLLYKAPEMLVESERTTLERFFLDRIDAAREERSAVPWREHLLMTLDYRAWHRFRVMVRAPGESRKVPLTSKRHAASSGGERAVALHLPLFAAAAAHYGSAMDEAPRLILLDEAFAGIDAGMRGRCMGLLVNFDLDFMMTSYDEWGCYEELPGVATYQLYREPTMDGVMAVRFVWNGERRSEDPV